MPCKGCIPGLLDEEKTWYATYLLGLATSCRMWQALNPTDMKNPIFAINGKALEYHLDQKSSKKNNTPSIQELKYKVAKYCSSTWQCCLNESQTNAVASLVCHVQFGVDPGVRMIQGPPGTGKTSTLVTLLSVAASTNMKCLTNMAIAEVALPFLEMLEKPEKLQFGEFCLSSMHSNVENSASITKICKILKKGDIITDGQQLVERSCFKSLLHFIVSIESTYEAQMIREDVDPVQHTSLLQFARNNMEQLIKNLIDHGMTLAQGLPIDQAKGCLETAKLAEDLLQHIWSPAVSEEGFSEWFSRNESLKRLQKCLEVKHGPLSSRESIEKFCMKSSSPVFLHCFYCLKKMHKLCCSI